MGFDEGYAKARLAELDAEIEANKATGKRLAEKRKRYATATSGTKSRRGRAAGIDGDVVVVRREDDNAGESND